MTKKLTIAISKVILLVLLLHLAIFYFRLGWFVLLIWIVGFFLSFLVTRSLRPEFPAIFGALIVGCVYVVSVAVVWQIFATQKSHRTFQMSWADRGSDNAHKQAKVELRFVDFPRHYVVIFSSELADYLREAKTNPVPVTMEESSVLWCSLGFHEVQIGELTHWKYDWSHTGVVGDTDPSPWAKDGWWCP
jgi:hypothetical protein